MNSGSDAKRPAGTADADGPPCPVCQAPLRRVPRRMIDRVAGLFTSVRRYRCRSFGCQWEGNLPVDRNAPASGTSRRR